MNPFVEHLPWRIAALAGLIVGAISVWVGVGLWVCLLRVGAAFVAFGLGGLVLRAALTEGQKRGKAPRTHVDQVTPPMSVEDVARQDEGAGRRGDESET